MKKTISQIASIEKMETWLSKKFSKYERSFIILCLSIIIYTIVFSALTIFRHHTFRTYTWDLGIFTQSFWTTINGYGFLYHTCELFMNFTGSFFAIHFSPILFFVLPIYWVAPMPETLLVLQSFVLALAAVPIYRLAKENAGGRLVGMIFALGYLMYTPIQFVNMYDFHVQIFLPFFLASTFYYLIKEKWSKFFLFTLLSLMCEEHAALIVFFIGVYILWSYRASLLTAISGRKPFEKKLLIPSMIMALSVAWYWFTIWQRNTFFPINPAYMSEFLGSGNFGILGARDPLEVPLLIVLRPLNAIQALAYDGQIKLLYIILLFGPLALFSFRAPSFLIPTIPWFGMSLFSQARAHHVLGHQYDSYVASFIFIAAIFALRKDFLKTSRLKSISRSLKIILVFSLSFFVVTSPLSPLYGISSPDYVPAYMSSHEMLLGEVVGMIPPSASVLTQDNIFPHVSHRINAYVVPDRFLYSPVHDLIVSFVNQTLDNVEYVLLDNQTDPMAFSFTLSLLETKPQFALIVSKDNGTIFLYKAS